MNIANIILQLNISPKLNGEARMDWIEIYDGGCLPKYTISRYHKKYLLLTYKDGGFTQTKMFHKHVNLVSQVRIP